MVTSRVLQANGYDFEDAARWCRRAESRWIETCFQSLGRDSSGFTRSDPEETLRLCETEGSRIDQCLWGAARDYVANFAGGEEAAELCKLAAPRLRADCFHGIGTILATMHPTRTERLDACRALSRRYVADCFTGTGGLARPVAESVGG